MHLVKIACEHPDKPGRSLPHWDRAELARQLVAGGVVDAISPQTVFLLFRGPTGQVLCQKETEWLPCFSVVRLVKSCTKRRLNGYYKIN